MNKKTLWITETAVMLALLIVLQWVTKPLGQMVTGSCVNLILAICVLFAGRSSGITVALLSPVFAFILGIAPQLITVPAIMLGNTVFVLLLSVISGKTPSLSSGILAWIAASVAKFVVLYVLVALIICGVAAGFFLEQGLLKEPMLKALPTMFAWPQLFTALIGGGIGLLISPTLRKAIHKNA